MREESESKAVPVLQTPIVSKPARQKQGRRRVLNSYPVGLSAFCRIQEIERVVRDVSASWCRSGSLMESRRWNRVSYEKPIALTPLDGQADAQNGEPMLACGRDISPGGIAFTHTSPLLCREVVVTFLEGDARGESIITRLKWCRFTRSGVYQSGGSFVRWVGLPWFQDRDWRVLRRA